MKNSHRLLILLLLLTITGCRTTPKSKKTVLPPKPSRQEIKAPESLKDYALIINYYEHLVQEWELWGETVTVLVTSE